jgi:hypothetical protein
MKKRQLIESVLLKYDHLFHNEKMNYFKRTSVVEHEISPNDTRPIRKPNTVPYALKEEIQMQVQNMLDRGEIRESRSPWSAPAILVPKNNLGWKPKFRFCVDLQALNPVTKFDSYPLPVIEETSSTLYGSKCYSVIDCFQGFWQINIREDHRERTDFTVPSRHCEFNKVPFGLSNSPPSFQRLMDIVLKNLLGIYCYVYLDGVIFSQTAQKHAQRL